MTPAKHDPVCAYCGKPGKLHRDHVVPRSRGGPDNATNIVTACQPCNSSKGDQLPSEWLGDRCPAPVLLIEARVNAKLKAVFKRRDAKVAEPPRRLYGFNVSPDGAVHYVGEVVGESPEFVRLEVVDGLMFAAGLWTLSGELRDVPRSECRLFNDCEACAEKAAEMIQIRHVATR